MYHVVVSFSEIDLLNFDDEWMTSKIDLTCLPEAHDENFNLVGDSEENMYSHSSTTTADMKIQSPSIVRALLGGEVVDAESADVNNTASVSISESLLEICPTSPEQHVPDVNSTEVIEEQFQLLLDSYLAKAKLSIPEKSSFESEGENEIFVIETATILKTPSNRELSEPTEEGPKVKVRTPEQKQRKRLQNRNAATKYRSKKRSEQQILNAKCLELETENSELRKRIGSKEDEIEYLKKLIIDVFSKKKHAGAFN